MAYQANNETTASSKPRRNAATNAGLIEIQVQYRAVADLALDSRNPRQHPQRQVKQIADSIREFGFLAPVVIDDTNQVVIGHGRVLAAKSLGMPSIPVIEIRHLSKKQLKAFRIADNKLAQHAHWDERLLAENFLELKELDVEFDLSITGFSLPEIDLALHRLDDAKHEEPFNEDDALTGVPVCRQGDVWKLGGHLLYCGDATSEASFDILMREQLAQVAFIDPPYNVPIDGDVSGNGKVRHREFAQGIGELKEDKFAQFLRTCCGLLAKYSTDGAIHYVCMDWRHTADLLAAGNDVYSELKSIAVWVKDNPGMGSLYRSQHEFVFVFKSGTGRHINNIEVGKHGRNRSNVWRYDGASPQPRTGNNLLALHPTAKPVDLVADVLLDCSERDAIVLDCFLGSGTTLLAAERTGRFCRGIELDPLHVDTAIRRWQKLTSKDAFRLLDRRPFRDIEAATEQ
jgi:DNA modification methylase